jgi:hypothetical protein
MRYAAGPKDSDSDELRQLGGYGDGIRATRSKPMDFGSSFPLKARQPSTCARNGMLPRRLTHREKIRTRGNPVMPMAKEYRQQAKECLELAKTSTDAYAIEAMTELAQEFNKAAEESEHKSLREDWAHKQAA